MCAISQSGPPVITASGLGKTYPLYRSKRDRLLEALDPFRRKRHTLFHALADVSFTVSRGECLGIIGVNGAGKSTLLKILTGVLTPSSGELTINGRVAALLELGAGFHPERTGIENVYYQGALQGLGKHDVDGYIQAVIDFADIGEYIHQPVKMYSSGMFVRLAFAAAIQCTPDILVVDEALSVGDVFFVQKCMNFIRSYMEDHTVVFVSHDIAAVKSLCNRVILLDKGRVKMLATPAEAAEAYIEAIYEAQGAPTQKLGPTAQSAEPDPDETHPDETRQDETEPGATEPGKTHPSPASPARPPRPSGRTTGARADMRRDFINATPLRNDIEVFTFNREANAFGNNGVRIESVVLAGTDGTPLSWVVGGEEVRLIVTGRAEQPLYSPIVGFYLKDRLGQELFGDNTYLAYENNAPYVPVGAVLTAGFGFRMPVLPAGEYVFAVAVAEGNQTRHIQLCWMHNALLLHSHSTSCSTGLMGIPMHEIRLEVRGANRDAPDSAI